MSLAKQITI